ncbi:hypothetical protein [Naasia lichenicola]|uniref:Uncharacterized protein n=1 Tax=Naasia lichenicola TaxID=2565933 RepID=A0A4S4FJP2_9MICO|nr:hypothetical protein [Naasia lichenicola]THG30134.1 hypothetical protein E6C64_16005 [Naasia lichenicola]
MTAELTVDGTASTTPSRSEGSTESGRLARRQVDPNSEREGRTGPRWLAHVVAALILAAFVITAIVGIRAAGFGIDGIPFIVMLGILIAVGWLLAWKRPSNPLGWLLLAVPGIFCSGAPIDLLGQSIQTSAPRVATWLFWYGHDREDTWTWIPPVGLLLTQIPLRFPDGHLPSPRWRWFSWFTVFALVLSSSVFATISDEVSPGFPNPTRVEGSELVEALIGGGFVTLFISLVGSLVSLFVRYRRADAVRSAQLRWVFWAVALAITVLLLSWLPGFEALQTWILLGYALIPVAVAIAVLRYHLYDIDRIISRTASYAIVTLVVIGTYALVVVGITAVLPDLPSVSVALATLAAAALFLPVLRLVQRIVDRRFDRARYDAQKVVHAFGERLRNGADPHTAAADLGVAVERSLQPSSMGLWVADHSSPPRSVNAS